MAGSIDIISPAAIASLDGTAISSLDFLPPDGVSLTDGNAGAAITITLIASASGVSLSASSAGGAGISGNGGTLTISGSEAEVNAALASLDLTSAGAFSGVLSIQAADNQGASKSTTLGLTGYADPPLAFVAPPGTFASPLGMQTPLTGLTLAADGAVALALAGAAPEMMALTLISTNGPLLLDPTAAAGIAISGDATGTLVLGFASSDLPQLNAALAAVDLVENGAGTLSYIAREVGGPLVPFVTSGSLTYSPDNIASASSETWIGGNGLWQAGADWSGGLAPDGQTGISIFSSETIAGIGAASVLTLAAGATLALSADVAVHGSLVAANATLDLAGSAGGPAALFALAGSFSGSSVLIENAALSIQNTLDFSTQSAVLVDAAGTLDAGFLILGAGDSLTDFGSLTGGALDLGTGAEAFLPGGGILGQTVSMASGAVIDFAGLLEAGAGFGTTNATAFTLAAGAVIEGGGTLVAGNFSNSAIIDGPGTIEALGPAPLTIAAGSVSGGAQFLIDPGAVLELGAVSPLYGVFNPTPLTIDSSVTLSFASGANATQDNGLYPSLRGEQAGVLLLDYPGHFAGTIAGFAPGDRIALPGLSNLSLANLTGQSFVVSGTDSNGVTQSDTIHAVYAAGLSPFVETDANNNIFIGLRGTTAQLTLNDVPATQATIDAVNGNQEPVTGLGILLPTANAAALSLTISATDGLLAEASAAPAATITLSGSTGLALNHLLGELTYTPQGGGSGDTLRFTGSGGALNGFSAAVAVSIAAPATLDYQGGGQGAFNAGASWSGGNAPANGDVLAFGGHAGAADIVSGSGEAGGITVTGAYDFAGTIASSGAGQNGAALVVDGDGVALFDANAVVSLAGSMTIGDTGGAGTAGIAGSLNAGSVAIAGNANAAGSLLDVSGSLVSAGPLTIGGSAAGTLDVTGHLTALGTTLGGGGMLRATGTAGMGLGAADLAGGTLVLSGTATASGNSLAETGGLIDLTGQSSFAISQSAAFAAGIFSVGAEARFVAGSPITIASAATLNNAGIIDAGGLTLNGIASLANGSRLAAGGITLNAGASLSLNGAMLTSTGLTIAPGAVLSGFGEIGGITSGLLPVINASGTMAASGGTLILGGDVTGNVTITSGAALDLVHGAAGGTISFTGADETLIINDVAAMQDSVSGMVAGDAIELAGVPAASVSIAGGIVTIADPSSFGFTPAASQPAPQVAGNGTGSTITMGSEMPCFARGTMLLTPSGYRPVEALAPGDPLITETGRVRGIVWIGSRVIDLATDPAAAILRPVVIRAGAFGKGLPLRKLRLSPLHAVYVKGALIPAVLLVNGATITRDDRVQAVTYYHVELARHDVVKAEGLAVETYRDTGNRHRFAAARGVPGSPVPAVAPLITQGTALADIRQALHERAFAFGFQLNHAPDIRLLANGAVIRAKQSRKSINLVMPERGATLHIMSRNSAPAETDPRSEDRRRLGICIGGIRVNGKAVSCERLEDAGWHRRAGDDRGYWTTGDAMLKLPPDGSRVSLELIGSVPVWLAPACPFV
jgi:hypothetical protein